MSSRHIPIRRLWSGVLFSAPDETERVPPDEIGLRPKKRRPDNIRKRNAEVPSTESVDDISSGSSHMSKRRGPLAMFAQYGSHLNYRPSPEPGHREFFVRPKEEKATLCLPVLKVSSTTVIEGTLAHTTLIQRFHNPSQMIIDEARHTFPLYDGAVVVDFECTIGDERRLRGFVMSKEQARQEYKKAVKEQAKAAALLEEHTPQIFETSLGNIPPVTAVEIKIIYIQELKVVMMESGGTEGVALIIPTSVAPRHGKFQPASGIICVGLDIKIMVLNDGKVNPDGCQEESGHIVYYDGSQVMESPKGFNSNGERPLRTFYCWNHHSDQPTLIKDFVFVIQMKQGHEIQSQAILCPPDDAGLATMMVSIRPSDLFRDAIVAQSFSGEILFLLDQSRSMSERVDECNGPVDYSSIFYPEASGPRKIDVLREAMLLVISGLPKTCSFNIVSWGSETWAMWEQSKEHSPDNIKEAKEYITQIQANLSGTDLLRALKSAVQRRRRDTNSTQIVVLTDGELDPYEPMEFVWNTRQELQNKIRFFTLGIGHDVNHSLLESIAELGGGFADIVDTTQNPRWHNRLNRLFKSSLEPDTWDCDIEIGHEFKRHSLMDYRLNRDTPDLQGVPYFQAPHATCALHPFKFTSFFFLIDVKDRGVLPSEVTITTTTHGARKKIYRLPVKQTTLLDGTMHRLAAKATMIDLEDLAKGYHSNSPLVDENAQYIGTKYSITSSWTCFVAIPEDEPTTTREGIMVEYYKAMYHSIGFSELSTTSDPDSDDDVEYDAPSMDGTHGLYSGRHCAFDDGDEAPLSRSCYAKPYFDLFPIEREYSCPRNRYLVGLDKPSPGKASSGRIEKVSENVTASTLYKEETCDLFYHPGMSPTNNTTMRSVPISGHANPENPSRDADVLAEDFQRRMGVFEKPVDDREKTHLAMGQNEQIQQVENDEVVPDETMLVGHEEFGNSLSESQSREESVTLPSSGIIDPFNWEVAVEYQNGQGFFELPESAKRLLHLHFCPNTALVGVERLEDVFHSQVREEAVSKAVLVDTLMTIMCYQTHLAGEEDIWDLIMERARDAVAEAIGQDILEILEVILNATMMHEHYKAATGVNGNEDGGCTSGTTCPVCDIHWQSSRTFFCPFDHKPVVSHVFDHWAQFWEHQKENGHMVCPRKFTGA